MVTRLNFETLDISHVYQLLNWIKITISTFTNNYQGWNFLSLVGLFFSDWSGNSALGFFRFSNSFTANFQLVVKPFPFVAEPWWQPQSHHHHHCCSPKQLSINNYYGHLHVENHQSSSKKVHHDHTMLIKPLMSCVINIANPKNACTQCRNWRNYLSSLY